MSIKNLPLFFDREEGDKIYFRTEDDAEIAFDKGIIDAAAINDKEFYLTFDQQPLPGSLDDPKQVLNDLLEE